MENEQIEIKDNVDVLSEPPYYNKIKEECLILKDKNEKDARDIKDKFEVLKNTEKEMNEKEKSVNEKLELDENPFFREIDKAKMKIKLEKESEIFTKT